MKYLLLLLLISCTTQQFTQVDQTPDVLIYEGTLNYALPQDSVYIIHLDIPPRSVVTTLLKSHLYAGDDWYEPQWFFRYSEVWENGRIKAKGYVGIYQANNIQKDDNYLVTAFLTQRKE